MMFIIRLFNLICLLLFVTLPVMGGIFQDQQKGKTDIKSWVDSTANESSELNAFFGESVFHMQRIFRGRGGRSIVTTLEGTVLAFQGNRYKVSNDGGMNWGDFHRINPEAGSGNAVLDETNGDILYLNTGRGVVLRSSNHGNSWVKEEVEMIPDGFGLTVSSIGAMQAGITLQYGNHPGRLIMPGRIMGPKGSNDVKWRPYHYSTAIYSDDGGSTWQTSHPFPVLGTGEAALAEITNGSIIYNSREHMSIGNRYIAKSFDGGNSWIDAYRSPYLPDGPRGSSYGIMGGLIRLPIEGQDILLYCNLDTDAGEMPAVKGGTITQGREKVTVWASFDGGQTWPVKRMIYEGPSAYSNLGVGRAGTSSEGKIFIMFQGGASGRHTAVQFAVFNLSWLLEDNKSPGAKAEPVNIYWTGMRDRWGGASGRGVHNNWSLSAGQDDWIRLQSEALVNMYFDAENMTGESTEVLINRQNIEVHELYINGTAGDRIKGFIFDTHPKYSDQIKLAGNMYVKQGKHIFKNTGTTFFSMADNVVFDVAADASLNWSIGLDGKDFQITKTGDGALILTQKDDFISQLDIVIKNGVFGGWFYLKGDLYFHSGSELYFEKDKTLCVEGNITFEDFGVDNITGNIDSVEIGTYQLIKGKVDFSNVKHVGPLKSILLDNGNQAYFKNSNGLELVITD